MFPLHLLMNQRKEATIQGILMKIHPKNMQEIYRITLMPQCHLNKIATLKSTSKGLLLKEGNSMNN